MPHLHHHPFCPQSRFVRLVLGEYGVPVDLVEERVSERRPEFLALSPAGRTPVLIDDDGTVVPGASVIIEYIDDIAGQALGLRRLMPTDPRERVEVRRLVEWFNVKLDEEATSWLVQEKIFKRHLSQGGAPDMQAVRAARANLRHHMRYIDVLASQRRWLAGDRLSYADFAAAAQLSCADYLDDAPWSEHEAAKEWYQRLKSRPAFRPLLAERVHGVTPPPHYREVDF